ncbi:hypothetical protein CKM354_000964800 [Cercospora kikuchii]|uniref:Secreted protein n=1 Tax=Cercospora kikuchii TaxID=84275 RepID=A0A9P3CS27_9PEZI|nr:uncharacterized protein CKM354_000964800 [Cercospora kikuchii]GIZ46522.1 hypothetical protein CKM354_000964800 [Cercospora kikuchii]
MNLFKLSAKTLAILGLLIVNNLVIASPLNITSADPSDEPSDDPSDEPSGKPDNPQDNLYYRCDPGRGRGQFSPNYYSKPPWPDRGRGKIDWTAHGLQNDVYYDESRDIKKTNAIDLQYCLNDMYHGIYEEEPGITDEEHRGRSRKEAYKTEGWYCRGNFFELGFKGLRGIWPAWKAVEACRGDITQAAIAGRPWVSCQPTSKTTSKPALKPEDPRPTSEPGGQKTALEPVCTNYCGGPSKAYNGTNNVLDSKEELDNTPAEEA